MTVEKVWDELWVGVKGLSNGERSVCGAFGVLKELSPMTNEPFKDSAQNLLATKDPFIMTGN